MNRVITASQALEVQREIEKTWRSTWGETFWSGWTKRRIDEGYLTAPLVEEQSAISTAATYYVSAEMCAVARAASNAMPEEALLLDDLPSRSGCMVLEIPEISRDRHAKRISLSVFLWRLTWSVEEPPIPVGIAISLYSDMDDERDDYMRELVENFVHIKDCPRYTITGQVFIKFNDALTAERLQAECDRDAYKPVGLENAAEMLRGTVTFLRAMFALMRQRLPIQRDERADRATRRRLEREGASKAYTERSIRIVTLRRLEERGESSQHSHVDWQSRWIVSGHWRNQWRPSVNAHRLVWITPYVKGPEDKPLVVKATVSKLVR